MSFNDIFLLNSIVELGCIYEGGNKENTSEASKPVVDANVNFRETYSNNSSKH